MKKLSLAIIIAIAIFSNAITEGHASTYKLEDQFVKNLKIGTLPNAAGHIGMTFRELSATNNITPSYWIRHAEVQNVNAFLLQQEIDPHDLYGFDGNIYEDDTTDYTYYANSNKVTYIARTYYQKFSREAVIKKLGHNYKVVDYNGIKINKTPIFKAGKYYVSISINKYEPLTTVIVGTKAGILDKTKYQKIYK